MASNPFENIVGKDFECLNRPPMTPTGCPALSWAMGGLQLDDDTGEWFCPKCLAVLDLDEDDTDGLFDDDEDDGEAFNNDELFVNEGERVIEQTPEERAIIARRNALAKLASSLFTINKKLSLYLYDNEFYIIDLVRSLEHAGQPAFSGKLLEPKILAVGMHQSKLRIDAGDYKTLKTSRPRTENCLKALKVLYPEAGDLDPMLANIRFAGNSVDVPPGIITIIVEQFEEAGRPPNREPDLLTVAAAWVYLKAANLGINLTKTKMKNIPGVKKNAFDRALESYRNILEKRNKADEGVELSDD